jgi:hypothetical protein
MALDDKIERLGERGRIPPSWTTIERNIAEDCTMGVRIKLNDTLA